MEEKIYFKPAKYGKGIKKRREKIEKKEKDEKDHRVRNLVLFLLLIAIIVIIILWLLRGKITTTGEYPANVKNASLICESTEIIYPKISRVDSDNKELQLSLIFNGKDMLKSVSLIYTLYYTNEEEVTAAEAFAHAEFNKGLYAIGFDSEKFDNKFTRFDNRLIVSLFANASDVNEYASSYFMINAGASSEMPRRLSEYKRQYETQGFSCRTAEE